MTIVVYIPADIRDFSRYRVESGSIIIRSFSSGTRGRIRDSRKRGGNHPINSITFGETRKTVSHLSDTCLTMIDLIELIGSFSAEIFGVEIRVGGMCEKILVENNPIKSINPITPTG